MRKAGTLRILITVGLGLCAGASAMAGLDVDFGADVRLSDDANLYFHISSRYFDRDPKVVGTLSARYSNPDDLSVSLFLSSRSGSDPMEVWRLRNKGLSWFQVGARCGVPMDAWFVPVRRDPGPPYGKAYGYWKRHKNADRLSDEDARNLVAIRMIHEYYGVPVETAMEWRAGGGTIQQLVGMEYRHRHGKKHKAGKARRREREHDREDEDHDRGNGHGRGHGKGRGHGD